MNNASSLSDRTTPLLCLSPLHSQQGDQIALNCARHNEHDAALSCALREHKGQSGRPAPTSASTTDSLCSPRSWLSEPRLVFRVTRL